MCGWNAIWTQKWGVICSNHGNRFQTADLLPGREAGQKTQNPLCIYLMTSSVDWGDGNIIKYLMAGGKTKIPLIKQWNESHTFLFPWLYLRISRTNSELVFTLWTKAHVRRIRNICRSAIIIKSTIAFYPSPPPTIISISFRPMDEMYPISSLFPQSFLYHSLPVFCFF
jgi:hypothetical protein